MADVLAVGIEQVEVAVYQQADRSIIRTARGAAAVECRGQELRYVPIDADVLGLRIDERVAVDGLRFGVRVLDRFLDLA